MFDSSFGPRTLRGLAPRLEILSRLVWIPWLVLACAPLDVRTEATASVDFSRYATYAQHSASTRATSSTPATPGKISTPPDANAKNDDLEALRSEIDSALAATRYRRVDEQAADLLIRVSLSEQSETRLVNAADPDADYYVPREFAEDTIVVEVFDASTGARVWRGTARTETPSRGALIQSDPEAARHRAVREMFEEFPE